MADFIKSQGHVRLYQATHRLSAMLQRLVKRRTSGIEMMQNFSATKQHYRVTDDPWFLLDAMRHVC